MKISIPLLLILVIFLFFPLHARALLGDLEPQAEEWAQKHGYKIEKIASGISGCRKGKHYLKLTKGDQTLYGIFFHPIYQQKSGVVTQVEFEFNPPVSVGKARSYAHEIAPIVATRPPTQTQKIKPDPSDPCISNAGGVDERYTKDYILEFHFALGGKEVNLLRIYNDYIR